MNTIDQIAVCGSPSQACGVRMFISPKLASTFEQTDVGVEDVPPDQMMATPGTMIGKMNSERSQY